VGRVAAAGSPAECEYLGRRDGEDDDWREFLVLSVVEVPIARHELKCPVPPGGPQIGQAPEQLIVAHLDSLALDHDVQPPVPGFRHARPRRTG
jgi:hypothetical protein